MKHAPTSGFWKKSIGLICCAGAVSLPSRAAHVAEQPKWFSMKLTHVSLDTDVEVERETRSVANTPGEVTRDRSYIAPTLDLGLHGSIYHPNLFDFDLAGQGGYVWETVETSVAGTSQKRDQSSVLQRYLINIRMLGEKPYAATFFAEKDHTFRDYDFFSRITVDDERYGGQVGYTRGPVPITVSVNHLNEDLTGLASPSTRDETDLFFRATNERGELKRTELSYSLNDFTRTQGGVVTDKGQNHFVTLSDSEAFGDKNWIQLYSNLYYNEQDTVAFPEKTFNDTERLTLDHSGTLRSFYDFSYDHVEASAVTSDSYVGRAAVRHQLYQSLTSTLDVHGQLGESSGGGTMLENKRVGVGLNESYTKRLGSWGRLSLGNNAVLDHEDRTDTGQSITVINESHTLTDGVTTFLNQPEVIASTIRVTDTTGTLTYQELLDYVIIARGVRTEIQRVVGGLIPSGGAVLVDYTASSQTSGSFSTASDLIQIRLDLFNNLIGIYGRLNVIQNYGGSGLILQNLVDKVGGAEVSWHFARAGAEYETFNSNLSPFNATRLFQSLNFEPGDRASLSFDFNQTWTKFPDDGRNQATYSFISRFRQRLISGFAYDIAGGYRMQRGAGFDQDLATARAGFEWVIGKLSLKAGYEFQNDEFLGEMREKHFFYFKGKRAF